MCIRDRSTWVVNLPTQANNRNTAQRNLLSRVNSEEIHIKDIRKIEELQDKVARLINEVKDAHSLNAKLGEERDAALNNTKKVMEKHKQIESRLESLNVLHKKTAEEKLLSDKKLEEVRKELDLSQQLIQDHARTIRTTQSKLESIYNKHALKGMKEIIDSLRIITGSNDLPLKGDTKCMPVESLDSSSNFILEQ
eukprot:TRINITY_DN12137_c0_g1_i1.p2 TRINITY_DN12137_c0_g1~~TRINITY_DN12137_c0_g1_i1.p2  ORF type:complete len:195 (+),score=38.12 TRINITY_DN12137_c0_g1_i1:71-655(+)